VAQTGLIAFVGLVAPQLVRSQWRGRFVTHSWLSAMAGGALLCIADILARVLSAPQELPVGVLTAVLGGGYLMWRLRVMHGTGSDT
jgi:iron complex transport system permease protein